MVSIKNCPNCGSEIEDNDVEFCTECGHKLLKPVQRVHNTPKGFFDNLSEKTSIPVMIFALAIFGAFLFIGSFIWSSLMVNGTIDLITYILLTVVFSVFFGAIFVGYFACKDQSYVVPNFSVYLGGVFAVVLSGIGLIFTFLMGILGVLSSAFSSFSSASSYSSSYQPTTPNIASSMDLSSIFKIILFILLIPVAAYLGVYLGYIIKQNI